MMTWTVKFKGRDPNGNVSEAYPWDAVVTAESVEMGIIWLEKELMARGLSQKISPTQFIPMVTSTRKVRILTGDEP